MIPKTIHYCWFGKTKKSEEMTACIASWQKMCPDFTITEWNEENFDVEKYAFTKRMYREKKWAFVADYVRLHTLQNEGGFYLDTDMLLLQSLSPFEKEDCVLGEETPGVISAGMVASSAHHPFIKRCRDFYDALDGKPITIPRALTKIFQEYDNKSDILVLPPKTFYPFDAEHIHKYRGQDLGPEVYGVHLWNFSWGHPLNKFFKKIGVYSFGKKCVELLGIKKILKKLLGFI